MDDLRADRPHEQTLERIEPAASDDRQVGIPDTGITVQVLQPGQPNCKCQLVWDREGAIAPTGRPTERFLAFCGQLALGWVILEAATTRPRAP